MVRMQFTPQLLLDLIAANWPQAAKLAWWARQLVKDPEAATVARHVHADVLRILRPAESMARRMLLILALKEKIAPIAPAKCGAAGHPGPTPATPTHDHPRTPARFPLTIRLARQGLPYVKFGPRIHVFGSGMAWRPLPPDTRLAPPAHRSPARPAQPARRRARRPGRACRPARPQSRRKGRWPHRPPRPHPSAQPDARPGQPPARQADAFGHHLCLLGHRRRDGWRVATGLGPVEIQRNSMTVAAA